MKYLTIIAILFFSLNNSLIAQTGDSKKALATEIKKINADVVKALLRATELEPKITAMEASEKDKLRKEKLTAWLSRFKKANTDYEKWMENFSTETPNDNTAIAAAKDSFTSLKTQIVTLASDADTLISK